MPCLLYALSFHFRSSRVTNKGYHEYIPTANVVELFCSYSGNIEWYEQLAGQIAMFLGWEAWEDDEERQIFSKIDKDRSIL
jgi:hypothetical protein